MELFSKYESTCTPPNSLVDYVWNVMAHAQKPNFVFRRKGRVHLTRRGRQFSRLLAAEMCASAVVILDTPCSEVVWRVMATHSIRQFPLHFPSRASPCATTFQLDSTLYIRAGLPPLSDVVQYARTLRMLVFPDVTLCNGVNKFRRFKWKLVPSRQKVEENKSVTFIGNVGIS